MGMMAQMRNLAPWFIITVGGLFVLFMVLSDSQLSDIVGRPSQNVGIVDGEEITYQEFSGFVEQARQNRMAQLGEDVPEDQMDGFRNSVWEQIVNLKLADKVIEDLGITVSNEEVKDVILGPNPPMFLQQNFIDSTGKFNREIYERALFDPQNKTALIQAEEFVKQQLKQDKLSSYVSSSLILPDEEILRYYNSKNTKLAADFVQVRITDYPKDSVKFTEKELQEYYDKNKDVDYIQKAQRKLRYVLFEEKPSTDDTVETLKNLKSLVETIRLGEDFKEFVEIYSSQPYSKDTLQLSLIPESLRGLLVNSENGYISDPALTPNGYESYKLIEKFQGEDTVVSASHILFRSQTENDSVKTLADSVYNLLLNGAEFDEMASKYSEDFSNAKNGGDLGWFGRGQMVKEFEEVCFGNEPGKLVAPIKTMFGYHIIKINGKSSDKFVVEKLVNQIKPSSATLNKIYNDANDFVFINKEMGFEGAAAEMNVAIRESQLFDESQNVIPGLGENMSLKKFSFENDLGAVSDVYKVRNGYVVAEIQEIIEEGYQPLEDVRSFVENEVIKEKRFKKAEEIINRIYEKLDKNNFQSAKDVYKKATVGRTQQFILYNNIPSIGRELAFSYHVFETPKGEVSKPFRGNNSMFIVKPTFKTVFDSTNYNLQRNALRDELLRTRKNKIFQEWLDDLKENAEITDNRDQFYK